MSTLRFLIVQRSPGHRFLEDFRQGFERAGHQADLLRADQFADFLPRIAAFRPTALFCVGLFPELSEAVQGALPLVHYELDKLVNVKLLERLRPAPAEVVLTTYKDDVQPLRDRGFGFVDYLPFCANAAPAAPLTGALPWDLTFVGSIVREETNDWRWYLENIRSIVAPQPKVAGEFEALVEELQELLREQRAALQGNRWVLPAALAHAFQGPLAERARFFKLDQGRAQLLLSKEAAHHQRAHWLDGLEGLTVFGPGDWAGVLPSASYGGLVDPYGESSSVFARSRINLNIQRIYAQDGLSDRVFNVLAAGGFLLADRNEAIQELFDEGSEVALYGTQEELRDRIRYFLAHPEEREAVSRRGHATLERAHRFEHRVPRIVEAVTRVT